MKRLRLRKLWVVVAIVLLLTPLLSGRLEKTDATAPRTEGDTETTTSEPLSGQMKIWFRTSKGGGTGDIDFVDTDGISPVQWNMKVVDKGGFQSVNTGYLDAYLSINGTAEGDWKRICDRVMWSYFVEDESNADKVMDVGELKASEIGMDGVKTLYFNARAAGIITVNITAQGYHESPDGKAVFEKIDGDTKKYVKAPELQLSRKIFIGSPLMIYDTTTSDAKQYIALKTGDLGSYESIQLPLEQNIYANNADIDSCKIHWFYIDAETNEKIELQEPVAGNSMLQNRTSKIISVDRNGNASFIRPSTPENGENDINVSVIPYKVQVPNLKAGITHLIGRIYLNGDSTSTIFVEKLFKVMVATEIKEKGSTLSKFSMKYGEQRDFKSISNDAGKSLSWKSYENYDAHTVDTNDVLFLENGKGFTANNFGQVTLEARSLYEGFEQFEYYGPIMTDTVVIDVESALLKGITNKHMVDEVEVINVGGTITLSTNVVSKSNSGKYRYEWTYLNGTTDGIPLPMDDIDPNFSAEGQGVLNDGNYSEMKIIGKKSGETITIKCEVFDNYPPTNSVSGYNPVLSKEVKIHIADTLKLNATQKTIAVGGQFTLNAISSINNENVTWTADDDGEFIQIEPKGKSAVITGLKSTNRDIVTVTAVQEINGTTISATCEIIVIPGIDSAEIIPDPSATIPIGGVTELKLEIKSTGANQPNYSKDEIKWVLKNKNGTNAEEIIELVENSGNILRARVTGLKVGEAYVAVVTNDTAQVEIAVITIRVVSEVTGIQIKGEKVVVEGENKSVKGYLDKDGTGTCELKYDLLPIGYVDDKVEVIWKSNNENIAVVDEKTGVVTYKAVGTAIITATVAGTAIADTCTIIIENPATGIELNPTSISLRVGETYQLEAKIEPETVTDASLTWESSNPEVATVNNGVIKAVAAGSAIITVRTSNGLEAQCVVTVLVPAEGIELNYYSITVKKGTVFYLSAKITPEGAYDKAVIFESSDEDTVFVEQDGTVTARKVGTVEITVTSKDNPELSAICVVTVVESVSGLTLNSRQETIKVGEQFLLKATVRPSDSLNQEVTFESADPSIATVDENGLITGVKGGVTVIIVKTVERGLMATCTITVQEDIQSITLSETETYLAKGKNKKLTATILPASATKKKLKWTSSDESIVIVDSEGNIHGVNLGEAIITATAQDDGKVSATCKVTVIDATTKITLNQTIIRIMERDTYQLTYTIEPNYASVQRVNWTTSDASVARVDSLGLVTGVGAGEAKIRATAADGSGVYAECTVIVTPIILTTNVRVDSPATTLVVGETRTMTARTQPRNTTEAIRWVSENPSVVTIDSDGNMRAVGPGVAQITAISSVSGIEGTSTITVLGLNATSVTLEQYDTFDLYLDGVDSTVTWFSRNKRIATVTRRGVVTGRREGTTDVVARVGGKLVSCEVNVEKLRK